MEPRPTSGGRPAGRPALHLLCSQNSQVGIRRVVLQHLLAKGTSLELRDSTGAAALHRAAGVGGLWAVQMLIEARAEINATTWRQKVGKMATAVDMCAQSSAEVKQWLKARGGKAYHELSEAERLAVSQASPRPSSHSIVWVAHHGRRQIDTTRQKQQPGEIGRPQAAVEQAWAWSGKKAKHIIYINNTNKCPIW